MRIPSSGLGAGLVALGLFGASPAAAGERPAAPTDQIGVPNAAGGWEVTPEGDLYGGEGEISWRYGPRLRRWRVRRRTLGRGDLPVVVARAQAGGVRYELRLFATGPSAAPVAVAHLRATNVSGRRTVGRWGLETAETGGAVREEGSRAFRFRRPATTDFPGGYLQPGTALNSSAAYAWDGRVLRREGRAVLLAPRRAALRSARTVGRLDEEGGRAEWRLPLKPGARDDLTFVAPLVASLSAPPALDGARAEVALERRWRRILDPVPRLELPNREAEETFRASLVNLLLAQSSSPWGSRQTVNLLNYHAVWLRDSAAIVEAYELAGLGGAAARALALNARFQGSDGLFSSRTGQYDGWGQALWAYAEHVRRGAGAPYARFVLPGVERAMAWLAEQRRRDPLGLLPVNSSPDNEAVSGHRVGDDLWAVMGAEGARDIARVAGDDARAREWAGNASSLRARVRAASRASAARHGGVLPPVLDAHGGHDWGNLWLSWPSGVFSPRDLLVTRTLAATRRSWREGIATYGRSLHGYLGFRVLETELARGEDQRVVAGLRAAIAHTTLTHGGCEFCGRVGGFRGAPANLTPHGWWAAEYVTLLRNILVREDGVRLRVLSALAPEWLRPGRVVAIHGAPTLRGRVSVQARGERGGAVVSWHAHVRDGTSLVWTVPSWAHGVHARGYQPRTRTVALHGPRGRLQITWRDP